MFFVLVILSIAILFVYFKLKYFTLYGPIPGKPPRFFIGNLHETGQFHGKYLGDGLKQLQNEYGDTFQVWLGPLHLICVCHPDDVQHVFTHRHIYEQGDLHINQHRMVFNDALICNVGPKYKRHAAVLLPLFRRGKILNNFHLIIECTDKLLDQWRSTTDRDPNHIHLNIVDQCQNLSLAIFGFLGFNYDLQTLEEGNINKTNKLTQALNDFIAIFINTTRLPDSVSKVYLKCSPRYRRARRIIEEYLNGIMEQEREKTPEETAAQKRTSLIASLVTSLQQDEKAEAAKPEQERKGLSREEVIHELLLFLVAGSETSGTVLAWFVYFMSKYPRVQTKLKVELGNDKHNHLTVEQIESFTYLDCVLREVFRFLPPAAGTTRTLTVDDRLPGSGVQLYKGDEIFIPFHNLARDKRCWKIDPDLFYPERFQGEDKDHHLYALIPFGGGHRQCIGQDLARFELKTIIARLMQHVTFGDGGEKVNSGGYVQRMTTIPKNVGVTITFE